MLGPQVAGGDGNARQQPAAADRHDERVDLGVVGQHLEGERALAGDDGGVVERVDVGAALVGGEAVGLGHGVGQPVAPSTTVAPSSRVRCTFTNGVGVGMTMVASMPRRVAW